MKTKQIIEKKGFNIKLNESEKGTNKYISAWRGNHVAETIYARSLTQLLYFIRH